LLCSDDRARANQPAAVVVAVRKIQAEGDIGAGTRLPIGPDEQAKRADISGRTPAQVKVDRPTEGISNCTPSFCHNLLIRLLGQIIGEGRPGKNQAADVFL